LWAKERSKVPLFGIPRLLFFIDAGKAFAEINALDGFLLRIPDFSPPNKFIILIPPALCGLKSTHAISTFRTQPNFGVFYPRLFYLLLKSVFPYLLSDFFLSL
jgi:hypothetical protein